MRMPVSRSSRGCVVGTRVHMWTSRQRSCGGSGATCKRVSSGPRTRFQSPGPCSGGTSGMTNFARVVLQAVLDTLWLTVPDNGHIRTMPGHRRSPLEGVPPAAATSALQWTLQEEQKTQVFAWHLFDQSRADGNLARQCSGMALL